MKSFPLLIFAGFAPLFAITDQVNPEKSFWNYFELILLALSISLFAAYIFDTQYIIPVSVQGIVLTCSFVAYSFARRSLGPWLGKFCIVIFWLALEFLFLKLSRPNPTLFLADALSLQVEWIRWNSYTGYLGTSAWILVCNLILYYALLKNEKISLTLIGLYVLALAGPVIYSHTLSTQTIRREDMIELYKNMSPLNSHYSEQGEYIPRMAVFISGLILIFAVLKNKTPKK